MSSLLLRRPTPLDLEAAKRIHCDPETNRFNPDGPPSAEDVGEMLQRWMEHGESHGFGYWAATDRQSPEAVPGFGGLMRKPIGDRLGLNMYFRLAPGAWGKGHASAIARAALDLAFGELGACEVFGLVRPLNLPSRRTLEKAGFSLYAKVDDVPSAEPSLLCRAVRT